MLNIDGLGNLHANQMFWTTTEAKGKGLDPSSKTSLSPPVIYYWPYQGGTFVVFPLSYILRLYAYGLQQYSQLNNSCPLCFLFCSVL